MTTILIPDNIRSSTIAVRFIKEQKFLMLQPCDEDQVLLLDHWARISAKALRTGSFSMWAKFSADAVVGGESRRYHGCFIMEDGDDHVLRWDLWELSGRTGGA